MPTKVIAKGDTIRLLDDTTRFYLIVDNPTLEMKTKVTEFANSFCKQYDRKNILSKEVYIWLCTTKALQKKNALLKTSISLSVFQV